MTQTRFPFSAVVGQGEARLALLLAAVDPGIGGVLLRGDKGSAKSTLARGLAGMLPGGAPFVELPLGATEDRVLGTLDLKAALTDGETLFRPGLLAAAHGGVLYVDEVNLLPDHLVDVLLDVATSGINVVERDGVSHAHEARFVLVGSMNPEEGELRPQLLDRFGLSVAITAPTDPGHRAEIVRRRLTHDAGGEVVGSEGDLVLRARLAASMPADLPDTVVDFACRLALSVGAEGLRADLVLCRAAAAFAGWEGRSVATSSDVERVAGLALGHRRRRRPFDPPTLAADELERALDAARRSFADAHPAPPPSPNRRRLTPTPRRPSRRTATTTAPAPTSSRPGASAAATAMAATTAPRPPGTARPRPRTPTPAPTPARRAPEPPAHDPALAELEAEIEAEGGTRDPAAAGLGHPAGPRPDRRGRHRGGHRADGFVADVRRGGVRQGPGAPPARRPAGPDRRSPARGRRPRPRRRRPARRRGQVRGWRWPPPSGPRPSGARPTPTARSSPPTTCGPRSARARSAAPWSSRSTPAVPWAPTAGSRRPPVRCSACWPTPTCGATGWRW